MFVLVAFVILSAHTPANGEVTHTQPIGEVTHTKPNGEVTHTQPNGEVTHTQPNGEVTHTQPNGEVTHTGTGRNRVSAAIDHLLSVHTLHSQPPHARSYSSSMPNKRTPIAAAKITMQVPLERNTKDPHDSDDDMPATLRPCGKSGPSCFCNGTVVVNCSAIPSSETMLDLSWLGITSLLPGVFSNMSALFWL